MAIIVIQYTGAHIQRRQILQLIIPDLSWPRRSHQYGTKICSKISQLISPWWSCALQDNSPAAFPVPRSCDACYGCVQSTAYAERCPLRRRPAGSVCGSAASKQNTVEEFVFLSNDSIALTPLLRQAICLTPGPHRSRSHQVNCLPATKCSRNNWIRATQAADVTNADILHKIKQKRA